MKSILVVDDEKLIRWSLCEGLLDQFLVYTAASADEALNMMGQLSLDAVVTDLRMPGMSGLEFVEELRRRRPGLPVFAISAYAKESVVQHLLGRGVREVLSKPFEMVKVREILEKHLGESEKEPAAVTSN